jgi:hypothetical protein
VESGEVLFFEYRIGGIIWRDIVGGLSCKWVGDGSLGKVCSVKFISEVLYASDEQPGHGCDHEWSAMIHNRIFSGSFHVPCLSDTLRDLSA